MLPLRGKRRTRAASTSACHPERSEGSPETALNTEHDPAKRSCEERRRDGASETADLSGGEGYAVRADDVASLLGMTAGGRGGVWAPRHTADLEAFYHLQKQPEKAGDFTIAPTDLWHLTTGL